MKGANWAWILAEQRAELDKLAPILGGVLEGVEDDFPEEDEPSILERLQSFAATFRSLADTILEAPNRKLLSGQFLSETEFHLIRSGASMVPPGSFPNFVKMTGLRGYSEYEVYSQLHYEDSKQQGLIYPDVYLRTLDHCPGGSPCRVTPVPPEQVLRSCLRADQGVFWQQHFLAEYNRFQQG